MSDEHLRRSIEILGMAVGRDRWVEKVSYFVEGTYGEYVKIRLSKLIERGYIEYWEMEVRSHMEKIRYWMNPAEKRTKADFDRPTALLEAIDDALPMDYKRTRTVEKFEVEVLRRDPVEIERMQKKLMKYPLDSTVLVFDMFRDYAPDLARKIGLEVPTEEVSPSGD